MTEPTEPTEPTQRAVTVRTDVPANTELSDPGDPRHTVYQCGAAELWIDADVPNGDGTLFLNDYDVAYWSPKQRTGLAHIKDLLVLLSDPAIAALIAKLKD